jgi:hypothetical protein
MVSLDELFTVSYDQESSGDSIVKDVAFDDNTCTPFRLLGLSKVGVWLHLLILGDKEIDYRQLQKGISNVMIVNSEVVQLLKARGHGSACNVM